MISSWYCHTYFKCKVILPLTRWAGRGSRSQIIRENLFIIVDKCLSKGLANLSASVFEEIAVKEDNSCLSDMSHCVRKSNLGLKDDTVSASCWSLTDTFKNRYNINISVKKLGVYCSLNETFWGYYVKFSNWDYFAVYQVIIQAPTDKVHLGSCGISEEPRSCMTVPLVPLKFRKLFLKAGLSKMRSQCRAREGGPADLIKIKKYCVSKPSCCLVLVITVFFHLPPPSPPHYAQICSSFSVFLALQAPWVHAWVSVSYSGLNSCPDGHFLDLCWLAKTKWLIQQSDSVQLTQSALLKGETTHLDSDSALQVTYEKVS